MNTTRIITRSLVAGIAGTTLALGIGLSTPAMARVEEKVTSSEVSRTLMTYTNDDNVVRVEGDGKTATITLNGEKIAEKPLDGSWSTFDVVGPKGDVIATLTNRNGHLTISSPDAEMDPREVEASFRMNQAQRLAELSKARAFGMRVEMPKVMLGITMGTPDFVLADQLGIDPSQAAVVTKVYDDLPAAKAGLQDNDIIVSVDSSSSAGADEIRQAMRDKKPGDVITFGVIRKGERKEFKVTLEAYSPEKMGLNASMTITGQASGPGSLFRSFDFPQMDERLSELHTKITDLTNQLQASADELGAKAGTEGAAIAKKMSELSAQINQTAQELADEAQRRIPLAMEGLGRAIVTLRGGHGGEDNLFVVPSAPLPPAPPGAMGQGQGADITAELRAMLDKVQAENEAQRNAMQERMRQMEEMLRKALEEKGAGKPQ